MTKLIKFYTQTCVPCKMMKGVVAEIVKDHPDLEYQEFDCSEGVPDQFAQEIRSVPTLLIIKPDQPNIKLIGLVDYNEIKSNL